MDALEILLLVLAGILSGFVNVVAGGGSLLTLPLMIFMGLPSGVANGTNRIAIIAQNVFAVSNFARKGIYEFPYSLYLGAAAVVGAIIGANLAVDIDEKAFNRFLALVMVGAAFFIVRRKQNTISDNANISSKQLVSGLLVFFLLGIYGGFLHAGIGFLIILALTKINHFSLMKANSIKVFVALVYSIPAVGVFLFNGMVDWKVGITLAVGTSLGGILGSHLNMKGGEKWIKIILVLAIIGMAIKLWFF
ncbi:sulfite exporter TauE/SafE family protein [Thermophagus sp. OGC60D27]|uniref:sulfite exporter TauE/SafE family protein n=1 Tax=Thermophagus sp. OGC60D27 TaxID=3458415 RepID=UPI0040379FFA